MKSKNIQGTYTRFVVLGCGHTGTSLISGILHRNGFWGCDVDWHYEPLHLTELCEKLLKSGGSISLSLREEIRHFFSVLEQQSKGRWTLKDPRLSDVIGKIAPFIEQPYKIIFNYRHPANTVKHLMAYQRDGNRSESENAAACEAQYNRMNKHILDFIEDNPDIPVLFVNYDDLVDRKLDHVVCRFVGKNMDFDLINPKRRRAGPEVLQGTAMDLYEDLNQMYVKNILGIILETDPLLTKKGKRRILFHTYSLAKNAFRKAKWRLLDRTSQTPVFWRIKTTVQRRYNWASYADKRGFVVRSSDDKQQW